MATITVGASGCDYTTIQEAINAASATEATTIVISAGTYNEDIKLDAANQKGDLTFVAAEGEEVIFAGYFDIGYREQGVGAAKWNAAVVFENIIFDQAVAEKHSLYVQDVKSFVMNNCKVIGDGEYGIGTPGNNSTEHAELNNCTFVNAGIQSLGNFSSNLTIDGCTFDNSCLNVQGGGAPGLTIKNTTFNKTLTDAHIDDSFYCIRSNDSPIFIEGTTFNIDSELTEVAEDQAKWGVFWQRQAGGTKWTVADIEVNFTDAAMTQTELLFNKNGTTNAANEAGRITISGITGNRKVEDILEKSEGIVNSIADGKYYIYDDGMQMSKTDLSTIYVDSNYTSDNVGTDKVFGVNAFADINAATK